MSNFWQHQWKRCVMFYIQQRGCKKKYWIRFSPRPPWFHHSPRFCSSIELLWAELILACRTSLTLTLHSNPVWDSRPSALVQVLPCLASSSPTLRHVPGLSLCSPLQALSFYTGIITFILKTCFWMFWWFFSLQKSLPSFHHPGKSLNGTVSSISQRLLCEWEWLHFRFGTP